ncbi:spermidine synthase [Erwinia piriflorinigrans]|uniref:Spermidine synthase 1 n=1 Tax=Erwinia piriflorinigrans CFBP 5888 TaxID=1161919 RepID=V5Z8E5_9GAMM|nr:Spermidine synthase 1 [Erwinia piriflorinigrans]CCG87484.1 Spermidine synthase 1 [Erwinia piriflorinigrans CFBP 5888]
MSDVDFDSSPLFKLRGKVVASLQDEHGPVTVIDNRDFRSMSFDRIFEQSKMLKSQPTLPVHNYIRAMLMAVALTEAKDILLLGLGGGSLLRSLYARDTGIAVDVVELRQAVMSVAQDYFYLPQSEKIRYFIDDAARFVADEGSPRNYQLIFSDLYNANALAPIQSAAEFLHDCATRLQPGGWLVLNHPQLPPQNPSFSHTLMDIFSSLFYTIAPSGNVVIFASQSPYPHPLQQLKQMMTNSGADFASDFTPLAQKLSRWPGSIART